SHIDPDQLSQALRLPQLGVYSSLMPQYSLIFLNLQNADLPFFQDKRVRQALLKGLNRAGMVSQLLNGQGVLANSPILPGSWAYDPALPTAAYDPAGAASLLDAAGWVIPTGATPGSTGYLRSKGSQGLSFALTVPNDPLHMAIAKSAQETWAGLGVVVTLNPVDPATMLDQVLTPRPRVFDAALVDLNLAGTPDPDPYPLWHQSEIDSGQNYGGFADPVAPRFPEHARPPRPPPP